MFPTLPYSTCSFLVLVLSAGMNICYILLSTCSFDSSRLTAFLVVYLPSKNYGLRLLRNEDSRDVPIPNS